MASIKHILSLIEETIPSIHKEGHKIIFIALAVTILLLSLYTPIGLVAVVFTLWCIYFFRDPERVAPLDPLAVVSAADGKIVAIETVDAPDELSVKGKFVRISTFLNVFNVHVNRIPQTGVVSEMNYHPGKFLSADMDKASVENERQSIVLTTPQGHTIICVQIAGMVARRIVCDLHEGQDVNTADRYGIIRFGSRVDIYLPEGTPVNVVEGQLAIGGETVFATLPEKAADAPKTKAKVSAKKASSDDDIVA